MLFGYNLFSNYYIQNQQRQPVKRTHNTIFTAILVSMLITLGGCENKSDKTDTELPVENSTEVVTPVQKAETPKTKKDDTSLALTQKKEAVKAPKSQQSDKTDISKLLSVVNIRGDRLGMAIEAGKLSIHPQDKPLILINLFDINDSNSIGQLPYLQRLQDKYSDRLLVIGIPTNTPLRKEQLNQLVRKMELNYFISFGDDHQKIIQMLQDALQSDTLTTPTTLLYDKEGINQGYYEGLTPIEMITHDILRISKQ
jgi:hypothetical protein